MAIVQLPCQEVSWISANFNSVPLELNRLNGFDRNLFARKACKLLAPGVYSALVLCASCLATARNAMQRRKILIVEDEQSIREALAEFLAEEGFQVVGAADGEEALRHLSQAGNWLILLDFMLPKVSGQDILRKLNRDRTFAPGSLVILISAFLEETTLLSDRVVGALPKPFNFNKMLDLVSFWSKQ